MENDSLLEDVDSNGNSPFLLACIKKESKQVLKMLKNQVDYLDDFSKQNMHGITPLMVLCHNKMTDCALEMLNNPMQCGMTERDDVGKTALMYAIKAGLGQVVNKILDLYEDEHLEIGEISDANGDTPLMLACNNYMPDLALKILKNPLLSDVMALNRGNTSALMVACKNKQVSVALKILDLVDERHLYEVSNHTGNTALILACKNSMTSVALKILEKAGNKYIFCTNFKDETALSWAKKNRMQDVYSKITEMKNEIGRFTV